MKFKVDILCNSISPGRLSDFVYEDDAIHNLGIYIHCFHGQIFPFTCPFPEALRLDL